MSLGVANEIIVGDKSTLSIGASVYNLKQIMNLILDRPVQRDVNSGGTNYSFGSSNHRFKAVVEISVPDLATVIPFNNRDANGDLPQQAVIMTMVPIGGGANVTLSFNAKLPHQELGHSTPEAKFLWIFDFVVTSETITVA